MIKKILYIYLVNFFVIFFVIADDTIVVLQNRLDKINNLYVHFLQQISNFDGKLIEEFQGDLWIKRPNLFYWHVKYPEENFLISDGTTLWFYIPSIQQVTAYCTTSISDNIFWMLFFGEKTSWNNYNIYQQEDWFFLKPIYDNTDIKECKIRITDCGIPEQFSFIEFHGECINYYLSQQNNKEIKISQFFFKKPKSVQLDDQRK